MSETTSELSAAEQWVTDNVDIVSRRQNGTLHVEASCSFPVTDMQFYELITHPENFEIFRNIQRCTFRKVLWNNGRGHQLVEVENESDWNLFVIRGAVQTRMIVEQDMSRGVMHFTLAPNAVSPLRDLYGRWTITPGLQKAAHDGTITPTCCVNLYQRFSPRNLPPFLFSAFAKFTIRHLRGTFEDLILEAQKIKSGRSSLAPYMHACMKEIVCEKGTTSTMDPASVLTALEEASNASTGLDGASNDRSSRGSNNSSRSSGASMALSSRFEPRSHCLSVQDLAAEGVEQPVDGAAAQGGYYGRLTSAVKTARSAWRSTLRWIDERIPLDDDAFENAWTTYFGDDFPRGLWLVVA